MQSKLFKRNLSQLYLSLVPVLTIVFGLGIGYVSYKIYLPIWLINVVLMIIATWVLGAHVIKTGDQEKKHLVACALFFIVPTMLSSMFAGLGAPPFESPKNWVASATEQLTRYYFLLAMGVLIAFGYAILREKLKNTAGNIYALIGFIAIQIAIPIFLIDMSFWGFYLTKLYRIIAASSTQKTPEWVLPLRNQFFYINMMVAALVYLATAAFTMSMKKAGWFKPAACNIYILISLLFFLLDVLPPTLPEPFATLNFVVSIPAIPFMLPYFIGINLLRKVDDSADV
ncbi:hypothetical protein FO440_06600 [Mucilaginibacter corticis]|uniref:DUF4386 domain-containing protein n=1 Tax=Mucilaginibacter corticis TaxID=2597670 RepID=A0A556MVG1_9SPHI|nr:hypothetical protein [Mucilaginibacter corticis]TSJ43852.1 hypothetical protein FO440_06600 [Mucilaginibacter corticis]